MCLVLQGGEVVFGCHHCWSNLYSSVHVSSWGLSASHWCNPFCMLENSSRILFASSYDIC